MAALKKNSLFWNSYKCIEACKGIYRGVLCNLPLASSSVHTLYTYSITSKLRYLHSSIYRAYLNFTTYTCTCVCVCGPMVFSLIGALDNPATTKIFNCTHHHETPSFRHFRVSSQTLSNHYSILHVYYYVISPILNK